MENFNQGIDSITTLPNGKIYITKGDEYVRYDDKNGDVIAKGYPKKLQGNWGDLPESFQSGFDSMAVLPNKHTYVTRGDQYIRYSDSSANKIEDGYPKPIKGNWGDLPPYFEKGFDAMATLPNGKIYVFKGSQYVRYSDKSASKVDEGYPKPIKDNWGDVAGIFTPGINAASSLPNGKTYLFSGKYYQRYADKDGNKLDGEYRTIAGNWGFEKIEAQELV